MIVIYFNSSVVFSLCLMPKTIVKFMKASVHSSMLLMGTLNFGDPVLTDKLLSTNVKVPIDSVFGQ